MGLEMNTNIVENLGKPGNLLFITCTFLCYGTYVLLRYLYDDFSLFPPNQCCRSSNTLGKVGRNTEKPQMSDLEEYAPNIHIKSTFCHSMQRHIVAS